MPATALKPYPWQRVPRLSQRIRYGQRDLAHQETTVLLEEFDQEHGAALAAKKLRCAMVMSYCLRGARQSGAPGDLVLDELMASVDRLTRARTWNGVHRLMHGFIDRILDHVVKQSHSKLERVIQNIQRDLSQDPGQAKPLQAYAATAQMHPDYLSRQFKRAAGQTFCEARRAARLARARHLLIGSVLKVSEIARRVGIRDASQFNREFRREYGTTARRFRLQHGRG